MLGGISIWQLLIVLAIVIMVFGTRRMRNLGGDLGSAIKGFRNAMREDDKPQGEKQPDRLVHEEDEPLAHRAEERDREAR
ncbi:MAG: Sec-independent protein translocase subunit TatA [Pseudomonadota bacterium]|nr:Sec-independent protein translocase subunit TatA [Pseudomonadota bacterium]